MSRAACPFCSPSPDRIFHTGDLVLGLWDAFPVSEGHALLITKRHVETWFDASEEERAEITRAIEIARDHILRRCRPDGFNIGINAGAAAGQTVFHLHVHVIPRSHGDVENPRGGVRGVIAAKRDYGVEGAQRAGEPDASGSTRVYPGEGRADADVVREAAAAQLLVAARPPGPEEQVDFLANIQALLQGGQFTATYKFALLLALADVAIERGDDSGAALPVDAGSLAEKFVEYYWEQCRPFVPSQGRDGAILRQNTGRQAAVIRFVNEARSRVDGKFGVAKRTRSHWGRLITRTARVVETMPLWKLQTVGGVTRDFLYPNFGSGSQIVLRPGVVYCLRRFHSLIGDLVRGAWLNWIRRHNSSLVGDTADLQEFLFGAARQRLRDAAPILYELQRGTCLYTGRRLRSPEDADIDHFIPFALYPHDYAHNLVLADKKANAAKSDRLAAESHLQRWAQRNAAFGSTVLDQMHDVGIPADIARTMQIGRWAYAQAYQAGTPVWHDGRRDDERLSGRWAEILAG